MDERNGREPFVATAPSPHTAIAVDLNTGAVSSLPSSGWAKSAGLGGRGYNSLALLAESGAGGFDADSDEGPLLVSCGALTGTGAPSSSRVHLSARSPLTRFIGSSNVGGACGAALHALGVDTIELRGRATRSVYLYLDETGVELRSAGDLWGLDTVETAKRLREMHAGTRVALLLIGPARERAVPLACIVSGEGHAAGRTGLGAVMGAKQVKAIVVAYPREKRIDPPGSSTHVKRYLDRITHAADYEHTRRYGQSADVAWTNEHGLLATKNYQETQFEATAFIDGSNMDRYVTRRHSCPGCVVHCKARVTIPDGPFAGIDAERPDYEPIVAWGSKCLVADPAAIIYMHDLCDRLGLDSVSAGAAVAFAMDLYERGIITEEETGGLEITWGDVAVMERLIGQMAAGEGFGRLLGQGIRKAARFMGPAAEKIAFHGKGPELTAFDPRGAKATALGYAVSARGGDFTSVYARHEWSLSPEAAETLYGTSDAADRLSEHGKAAMVRRSLIVSAVMDSLGMCKVPALKLVNDYGLENEADLVTGLTGTTVTGAELFTVGERIVNAERLLNFAFGALPEDDTLPSYFVDTPVSAGPSAGSRVDLAPMLSDFYALMGWTPSGYPTQETLEALGLEYFAPDPLPGSAA